MAEPKIIKGGAFGTQIAIHCPAPEAHKCKYFPDGYLSFVIVGQPGSGKSMLLLSIIPNIEDLKAIVIVSRVGRNQVYDAIEGYCKDQEIDFQIFNEPDTFNACLEDMTEEYEPTDHKLIVFDDFSPKGTQLSAYTKAMENVSMIMRNYGFYSIYITQSATNVPTIVRNNATVRITFNMSDTYAKNSYTHDFINDGYGDKEDMKYLMDALQKHQHSFIMTFQPHCVYISIKNRLHPYSDEAKKRTPQVGTMGQ